MNKTVLVTGAKGMLGNALCPLLKKEGYEVIATDVTLPDKDTFYLNITSPKEVNLIVKRYKPGIIFHLAAETDVDKCETNPMQSHIINVYGTKNIVRVAKNYGCIVVYISTGDVFDGKKTLPYIEIDKPNPQNVYGRQKLEGEKIVASLREHYIVRTNWLFGGGADLDKKFVGKIINQLKTKKELNVVNDKFGNPTYTRDLAKALIKLVKSYHYGIHHIVNDGCCSRYEMALRIIRCLGLKDIKINAIGSDAYPLTAHRVASVDLASRQVEEMDQLRPWQEAIWEYVKKYYVKNKC